MIENINRYRASETPYTFAANVNPMLDEGSV